MPKVALLKGSSQYGVLRYFIDDLAEAFKARGRDVFVLDVLELDKPTDVFARLHQAGPLELIFSISICGDFRDEAGRTLAQAAGAPHVLQYVDHPLHHLDRLLATSQQTALLLVDESHVRAVRSLLAPLNFAYVGFAPHGASGKPCEMPTQAEHFMAARPIELLFAGSVSEPAAPPWAAYPSAVQTLLNEAAELALSHEWVPCLEALERVLQAHGMDPYSPSLAPPLAADLFRLRLLAIMVHDWTRMRRRAKLLQTAGEIGLPLTLVGNGCEFFAERFKHFQCLGALDFAATLNVMQRARMVLNSNANFGEGSHERPLIAALAGAAAATDLSTFYTRNFQDGRDIALYRWMHLDDDLMRLNQLLHDPDRLFALARAGHANTVAHHRWENRVTTIIAAAEAVRQNAVSA